MKKDKLFKQVESICKQEHIMEKHYGVESFPEGEPYFTTSQETDILEMIMDGLDTNQIVQKIRKW